MRAFIFFALLLLLVGKFTTSTGCGNTIYNHGVPQVSLELSEQIKIDDNKEKVIYLLGSPTLSNKNVWYYVSYKIKQANFLGRRKYSSRSIQISFDPDDNVIEVKKINMSERRLVDINID
ncbi:hypothetical protein BIY23_01805 [Wolbachia pipientis]|uniref:Outer membrane protein assembly factor BamE domain-containing protein n=1 Tax=Wolbachia pipientis TaxID=955 RepID=A0A1E7QJU9_WOLPI|nr:outer membrane protein assembly factor BamE [Wolbachia pipientis]OEY86752.1 hypothetical protein BIY23_01805 [Wolbachia pipientis]